MALINCPECGKENISDSASSCPSCGYCVKEHFEKMRLQEKELENKKHLENERQKSKIEEKERQLHRINSIQMPAKPRFSIAAIIISVILFVLGGSQLSTDEWLVEYSIKHGNGNPIFYGWFFIISGIVIICVALYCFGSKMEKYKLAKTDFAAYKANVIAEQDKAKAEAEALAIAKRNELSSKPHCPYCNSQNTCKITTTQKAVNTAMFGVLGNKRKHEWHCNNCKSDF